MAVLAYFAERCADWGGDLPHSNRTVGTRSSASICGEAHRGWCCTCTHRAMDVLRGVKARRQCHAQHSQDQPRRKNIDMKLNPRSWLIKNSQHKSIYRACVDLDEDTDDCLADIANLRQVQSVRAIAAEAEYVKLRTQVNHLQKELSQLKAETMNQLNEISHKRTQGRKVLTIQHQRTTDILHWQKSETDMNRNAEQHNHRLSDFRCIVQQTTDAMFIAGKKNVNANRRLLKIEETLKFN